MAYIYNLTDTWTDSGTSYNAIKMDITNTASSANAYMLNLTTSGATTGAYVVDKYGNLFVNATVRAWISTSRAIDIFGFAGIAQGLSGACIVGFNTYLNTSGQYAYKASTTAALYACGQGGTNVHSWSVAASGTSDGAITFTRAMTLDANSNLLIGTTTSPTTATRSLTLANGTAPTAVATTTLAMYSSNLSANNTIPSVWTEGTGITTAGITNTTVTNKIAIRVNGTVYYLLATTDGT